MTCQQHITTSCTSQGPAPALTPTQPPVTPQAPAQPCCILLPYQLLSENLSSFTGQGPAPKLASTWDHGTSQAAAQAQGQLLPYHLLTYDITCTCTSHVPPSSLSHLQGNMTTQAPPQASSPFILNQMLRQYLPLNYLHKPGACFCPTTSALSTDITGTCTSQGPAPALFPSQAPVTP